MTMTILLWCIGSMVVAGLAVAVWSVVALLDLMKTMGDES
jgi:hypothetical protein